MKKEKATLVVTKAFKKYPSEASVYILIAPPRYILAEHFCTNHYFALYDLEKDAHDTLVELYGEDGYEIVYHDWEGLKEYLEKLAKKNPKIKVVDGKLKKGEPE